MVRITSAVAALIVAGATTLGFADDNAAFDQLIGRTDALTAEVAKLRGLRVRTPIKRDVVDRAELARRIAAMAAEEKTQRLTASEGFALARWGLIPLAVDYPALLVSLRSDQILGYYDPAAKRLTMARGAFDDGLDLGAAELVLAHEIEHGLQDQTFDLVKFENLPDTEGDAKRARRALVEGDALATMVELVLARRGTAAPWSNPDVTTALEKGMTVPGRGDSLDAAPMAVREALMFPYQAGLGFVAALRRRQSWRAVDAAFAKPPKSSEHILHPERYQAGDDPIPIDITPPTALADFAPVQTTVWGEHGFTLFLRANGVDSAIAAIAGEGWGGDRVMTLARTSDPRPERGVGIARFEWDSEPDAIEAAEAIEKALDRAVVGATIEHTPQRTRWMALDGSVASVERRGTAVVMVIGAPMWTAAALGDEMWRVATVRGKKASSATRAALRSRARARAAAPISRSRSRRRR